mgnify:CR=1 FL=1
MEEETGVVGESHNDTALALFSTNDRALSNGKREELKQRPDVSGECSHGQSNEDCANCKSTVCVNLMNLVEARSAVD